MPESISCNDPPHQDAPTAESVAEQQRELPKTAQPLDKRSPAPAPESSEQPQQAAEGVGSDEQSGGAEVPTTLHHDEPHAQPKAASQEEQTPTLHGDEAPSA